MSGFLKRVVGLAHTFSGLIVYWIMLLGFGIKPAILATTLFVVGDGIWRWRRHKPMPALWLLSSGVAVVFGVIDLWAMTPFMLRYEGAITNLVIAAVFGFGVMGKQPLVLRIARERRPNIPDRPEVTRFFRAFTVAWSLYFVIRAAVFVWIMTRFPLVEAMGIRSVFSWVSLGMMMLISFNGRRVFAACQRLGLFRPARDEAAA